MLEYYQKYRDRELHTSQLETQLAKAQLQVLKMQLHPHFLFNTLHAISALMHKDVERADLMIVRLSELLRQTLENGGTDEVLLRQELDFIKTYLEIQQIRLGARLTVEMDVDPGTMHALVPNLILQPIVENAIRHGIAPRSGPGRIEIRAEAKAIALAAPGLRQWSGTGKEDERRSDQGDRAFEHTGPARTALWSGQPAGND